MLALLACLVAAGVLRLTGLDYALPEFGGHDERVFLEQTEFFRKGKQPAAGDEWVLTAYPHLLPRLGALLPSPERRGARGDARRGARARGRAVDAAAHAARAALGSRACR